MLQQICHGLFNATLNYNKNTIWIELNLISSVSILSGEIVNVNLLM